MHITFLGGTRFIGPPAVREALARGHQVSVLHRGEHTNLLPGAVRVFADRADPDALQRALAALKPDVVVDTRAMTRAQAQIATAALPAETQRWIVLSSQDVYGQFGALLGHPAPPAEERITESSPLTVPFPYKDLDAHRGDADYDKKDVERIYRPSRISAASRSEAATPRRVSAAYSS